MERLEARGIELAWESLGDGAPILLVHETGTTSAAWRAVAEAAAAGGARAIPYDRRGWGASTAPDDYRRTTVEEHSEDLAALIGAAADEEAVVCGAGLGAVIALDLLVRSPDLIAGAVLVEPLLPGLVAEATELLSEDREAVSEAVRDDGMDGLVDLYLSGTLRGLGPGAERLPAELSAVRERPNSLVAELGAAPGWAMPLAQLGMAERPVAIVCGADAPPPVLASAEALGPRLGTVGIQRVSGPGPPHLSAADEVAAAARSVPLG